MNTSSLRHALEAATQAELADVIDWIRRPWAPGSNDSLRGAWHELRKRGSNRMQLLSALEHEIRSFDLDVRDREYVANRVGAEPLGQAIADAIERRIRHDAAHTPAARGDVLENALCAAANLLTKVLEQAARTHRPRRSSRGRHHGR